METSQLQTVRLHDGVGPHSLGTLIEWKPTLYGVLLSPLVGSPHSLGTLIEWKRASSVATILNSLLSPLAGDIN